MADDSLALIPARRGAAALHGLGLTPPETRSTLNLFMNIPWTTEGCLSFEPAQSQVGDHITLEAQLGLVIAFSACPQDILPINGRECVVSDAHFPVED